MSKTEDFFVAIKVSGTEGIPTGMVDITDSRGEGCNNLTLDAEGEGTCEITNYDARIGSETITAAYKGDTNYSVAIATHNLSVIKTNPTVEILSVVEGNLPASFCSIGSATVTVKVTGNFPTGLVRIFMNDLDMYAGKNLSGDEDVKTFEVSICVYEVGNISVVSKYLGDVNNNSADSAAYIYASYITPPLMIVSPDPNMGQLDITSPVEFLVHVLGYEGTPTGEVTISNSDTSCTTNLTEVPDPSVNYSGYHGQYSVGEAICSFTFSAIRVDDVVTATYSDDSSYHSNSISNTYNIADYLGTTTTITSVLPEAPLVGDWVTVIVTVTLPDGRVPDGKVQISGADTTCTINLTNGEDRCSVQFNSKGDQNPHRHF